MVVSGSVVLGRPDSANSRSNPRGQCSGDDFECYRPAQAALLADLAAAAAEVRMEAGVVCGVWCVTHLRPWSGVLCVWVTHL